MMNVLTSAFHGVNDVSELHSEDRSARGEMN